MITPFQLVFETIKRRVDLLPCPLTLEPFDDRQHPRFAFSDHRFNA
jgi:hypothetical protein